MARFLSGGTQKWKTDPLKPAYARPGPEDTAPAAGVPGAGGTFGWFFRWERRAWI